MGQETPGNMTVVHEVELNVASPSEFGRLADQESQDCYEIARIRGELSSPHVLVKAGLPPGLERASVNEVLAKRNLRLATLLNAELPEQELARLSAEVFRAADVAVAEIAAQEST